MLHEDMKNLPDATWECYIEIYLSIPTDKKTTGQQPGVAHIIFYDDGEPSMIQLSDAIAEYMDSFVASRAKLPYLIMAGATSHKIIGSLALIHAGEKLKEAKSNAQSSDQVP
jgi:hypothetical protein